MKSFLSSLLPSFFDDSPEPQIGKGLAKAYNDSRFGKNHKTFCYAPSTNMLFAQNGNVYACCHNKEIAIGRYPEQTISEIWNSQIAIDFRSRMEHYDLSAGCEICKSDLKPDAFQEVRARHFDTLQRNKNYPVMMEFLLTNICNLECVMCMGEYSSLIRKNREKLPTLEYHYDQAFIFQLDEFIPYLKETRFSGSGEAFDVNYEIWEKIIKLNPKCVIMVQTNGTILTDRVKSVLSRGNFQIGVSLDSLKKNVYESIRLNANFDKVMSNIRYFSDYCKQKKIKFNLSLCVMRQNWEEMPAYIEFCNELDCVATFHKVWHPRKYALDNLPVIELVKIYDYLSKFDFEGKTPTQKLNREHYHYFISVIKEWRDKSREVNPYDEEVSVLGYEGLIPYLSRKLYDYLIAQNHDEATTVELRTKYITKISAFVEMFDTLRDKERVLRAACLREPSLILYSLENFSIEENYKQFKSYKESEFVD